MTAAGLGAPPADVMADPIRIGVSMVGGSIPDGGDDVGPGEAVQRMIEADHPVVTISGMPRTSWAAAQPIDPGSGPDVYDWSELDAQAADLIPGKALLSYYQMWGTSPGWVEEDTPRFWEKFEAFVTAMTVHINQNWGPVDYIFENEPNIPRVPDGWTWPDWYIHTLAHFYPAVHAAEAQTGMANKVIAGNLAGHSAGGFNDLYARGLKDISDILGYHAYPFDIRDGVDVDDLAQIHGIQENYGDGAKQIFVSEGWGSGRSAGFDRSSPKIEPTALEIENMYLAMVKGLDNVMTPQANWHPDYLWGMRFFTGNDNWGAMNWRSRATVRFDGDGDVEGFNVDGYQMGLDIAPYFWNGGMMDFYGNSKDCLIHVFPGDGLVFMNPGFELPSDPPNAHLPHFWTTEADPAPTSRYHLDTAIFHGGQTSLRLERTSAGTDSVRQMTARRSAEAGVSYRARVWCRTEEISGLNARFYLRFMDLDGTAVSTQSFAPDVTGSTDWTQTEVIATAPGSTSRIEVGCMIDGQGTAWFDDVTISEEAEPEVGTLRGYTLDEGQIAVPDCIVRATTGSIQTVSDGNGYFELTNVPTGTYDFVCRKAGYVPHRVRNQTVAAGKLTFVSFNMDVPKPGLTVTSVEADRQILLPGGDSAQVTVTVSNSKPYPIMVEEVSLFVEESGTDVTDQFQVAPEIGNPEVIPADASATFDFDLTLPSGTEGQTFDVNAFAFGQEDRPNLLKNGGFDGEPWDEHWQFNASASTVQWSQETNDYHSSSRSARCYIEHDGYSWWNWAINGSNYEPDSPPAKPAQSYTVGVHHRDENNVGGVHLKLLIQEQYYDGNRSYVNGRRWAAVPPRGAWAHDVIIYETGDPNVIPGLYSTNRLLVGCGPQTTPPAASGTSWWDDLYVKETGDWLADDRAASPVPITVTAAPLIELTPESIQVTTQAMSSPASESFTLRNGGIGTLTYTIGRNAAWLWADPASGTSAGEEDVVTIHFATSGLAAGHYEGEIDVTDPGAANSPATLRVELEVVTAPADFDGDGDCDQNDFSVMQACLSGTGVPPAPDCLMADLDGDEDVDSQDVSEFQGCMGGADVQAVLNCAGSP